MGISQVTYLTAKSVRPAYFSVNEVRPQKLDLQEKNNLVTVLGSNFGNSGSVLLEYYPPVSYKEMENCPPPNPKEITKKKRLGGEMAVQQYTDEWKKEWAEEYRYLPTRVTEYYDVTPKITTTTPNLKREDTRIVLSLDEIMNKLKSQSYIIRVEKDGLLTYANSDAAFEITSTPRAVEVSASTDENKSTDIKLIAIDPDVNDKLTYSIVTEPSRGTLTNIDSASGKLTYTPNKDQSGEDSFSYKVNDGKVDSNIAAVKINIKKTAAGQ